MRPFEGIRVIDATHVVAGPFSTYQLAALGAEVIKVEPPEDPDQTRSQGGDVELRRRQMGTWFLSQNANKRCLTVDLKNEKGRELFKRLISTADVLVENYRPGAFAALGLDYQSLSSINPRLIYCSVSAFGQEGPRGTQTGYDLVIQASAGLMAMTGTPESGPVKIGTPVVDYATGMSAAFAMASALLQRERTGKGQRIDVAMFDVALTLMALNVTSHTYDGYEQKQVGNRGPFPTTGCYETKDGLLMIGASNHRQQHRLWHALGRPDMIKTGDAALTADREPEFQLLAQIFLERTATEWEGFLQDHHVPAAKVRTMKEALQDPQLEHRGVFQKLEPCVGVERPFAVGVAPFLFDHGGPSINAHPRAVGADTDSILTALGYTSAEVSGLRNDRVI